MAGTIPERADIQEGHRWDLSPLFSSEEKLGGPLRRDRGGPAPVRFLPRPPRRVGAHAERSDRIRPGRDAEGRKALHLRAPEKRRGQIKPAVPGPVPARHEPLHPGIRGFELPGARDPVHPRRCDRRFPERERACTNTASSSKKSSGTSPTPARSRSRRSWPCRAR